MSYTQLIYHIVFRPKYSAPVIVSEYETMLYRYIWGFVQNKGGVLYRIGGMSDHIHLCVCIPPTMSLSGFMHDLKLATHNFLRTNPAEFPGFRGWGKSYCALTCSASAKDKVVEYIKQQKTHHQYIDAKNELLDLLRENGIEPDMKFFLQE